MMLFCGPAGLPAASARLQNVDRVSTIARRPAAGLRRAAFLGSPPASRSASWAAPCGRRTFAVQAALPALPVALQRVLSGVLPIRDVRWHWALLATAAAAGPLAERYTVLGSKLSAVVVSLLAGMLFSNAGILPPESPAYDAVWSYLVPLAIPLLLLRADLRRLLFPSASGAPPEERLTPVLKGYVLGALGIIIGCVVGVRIFRQPDFWKLGAMYIATLVGGSMNFIAVAEALGVRAGDFLTAAIAADNLSMAVYFLWLFQVPKSAFFRRLYGYDPLDPESSRPSSGPATAAAAAPVSIEAADLPIALGLPLAFGAAVSAAAFAAQSALNRAGLFLRAGSSVAICLMTAFTVALATAFPAATSALSSSRLGLGAPLGSLLMSFFFSALGVSASVPAVLALGPAMFGYALFVIGVQAVVLFAGGAALGWRLDDVVLASNVCVGGPTTAAGMANSLGWHGHTVPGILLGTAGYAFATFLALALVPLLR